MPKDARPPGTLRSTYPWWIVARVRVTAARSGSRSSMASTAKIGASPAAPSATSSVAGWCTSDLHPDHAGHPEDPHAHHQYGAGQHRDADRRGVQRPQVLPARGEHEGGQQDGQAGQWRRRKTPLSVPVTGLQLSTWGLAGLTNLISAFQIRTP